MNKSVKLMSMGIFSLSWIKKFSSYIGEYLYDFLIMKDNNLLNNEDYTLIVNPYIGCAVVVKHKKSDEV